MEKGNHLFGTVLWGKVGMSNSSSHSGEHLHGEQANSGDKSFFGVNGDNILSDLYKKTGDSLKIKAEMETVKTGWLIYQLIGFPVYIYSWLNSIWTGDELKQWVLFFFGAAFAVIEGLRRYEVYKSRKMDNADRIYDTKRAHKKAEREDKKAERDDS